MTFKELGLSDTLLKAIEDKGYKIPSPIQAKAIPPILKGRDVLASAQTGTGKTAGFTLPVLQNLVSTRTPKGRPIRALILTPTRELAAQIYENVEEYSKYLDIKSTVIFGGVKAGPQIRKLKQGVDILVATPGRLLDLHNQKELYLNKVDVFILDEADRMLDMGFVRDINKIIALLPSKRQNLMFSATFSKDIKKLAGGILRNPVAVDAAPQNSTADTVSHKVYSVNKRQKAEVLINLINENNWSQVLVFTRTKHGANNLTKKLNKANISAVAIHGNKSQGARTKALTDFKANNIRILVATDIAARGLDIPLLPHVINFELPNVPQDYIHRIGRTGRAGAKGEAISLVCSEETEYLNEIEKLLKDTIELEIIEGYEPTNTATPLKASTQNKSKSRNTRNASHSRSKRTSQNSRRRFLNSSKTSKKSEKSSKR